MTFLIVASIWFGQVPDLTPATLPLDVTPAVAVDIGPAATTATIADARVAIVHAAHADLVSIDVGDGATLATELDLDSFLVNTATYDVDGTGRRVEERLIAGTLADGTFAVVARLDVAIALTPCCGGPHRVLDRWRETHVVVCSVSAPVRCGDPVLVRCPRRGCGRVRLRDGRLTVVGRRGRRVQVAVTR